MTAEEERLFLRLIVVADDYGRFEADPVLILSSTFPLAVHRISVGDVDRWLQAILAIRKDPQDPPIRLYNVAGRRYGYFVNWLKHNTPRARHPKYPGPEIGTEAPTTPSPAPPVESETKKVASEAPKPRRRPRAAEKPEGFDWRPSFRAFWDLYPHGAPDFPAAAGRRIDEANCQKDWTRVITNDTEAEQALAGLKAWRAGEEWNRSDGKYVPKIRRFIEDRRWKNAPPAMTSGTNGRADIGAWDQIEGGRVL